MKFLHETFFVHFKKSFKLLFSDYKIFLYSIIPILLGAFLYVYMGKILFLDFLNFIRNQMEVYLGNGKLFSMVYYFVFFTLGIFSYFFVGWTFILTVSLLGSPFNSWLSRRVIFLENKTKLEDVGVGFFTLIWSEIKKYTLIICLSCLIFVLSFIPFVAPFGILFSAILVAANFLDYSWGAQNLHFKLILTDFKKGFKGYFISGLIFLGLLGLPILNLIFYPVAVIYFTLLQINKGELK